MFGLVEIVYFIHDDIVSPYINYEKQKHMNLDWEIRLSWIKINVNASRILEISKLLLDVFRDRKGKQSWMKQRHLEIVPY